MMLLTSWGIITTVLPKFVLKTSYFGLILTFMEKQNEYLVIGDRFANIGVAPSRDWFQLVNKLRCGESEDVEVFCINRLK